MTLTTTRLLRIEHTGTSSRSGQIQRSTDLCLRIGRRPDNHVVFDVELDRAVSGYHVEVQREGAQIRIRDLESANGTFVDDVRITGEQVVDLPCTVRCGASGPSMRLSWEDPELQPSGPPLGRAGIGEATLERAIDAASVRERRRGKRSVIIIIALIAMGGIVIASSLDHQARRLDTERQERSQAEARIKQDVDGAVKVAAAAGDRWTSIARRYRESIFLCVAEDPATEQGGIGTAFVVKSNLLATNAHVAQMLIAMPQRAVVQNHTGRTFAIRRIAIHPGFDQPLSPDVALIEIDPDSVVLTPVELADYRDLQALEVGTELGTLGYPGELGDGYFSGQTAANQRLTGAIATFKTGYIGRMLTYELVTAGWQQCRVIQHSASLTGGTSGSPMFTADGKVVALNNAGLDQEVLVNAGGQGIASLRMANPAQIGLAIRVDELREFMAKPTWQKQ